MSSRTEGQERLITKLKREFGTVIIEALNDDSVIEIMLNDDGTLWIEKLGENMVCVGTPNINAKSIIGTIASYLDTSVTRNDPILECNLPIDGSRFEGIIPPCVSKSVFTIRKKATQIFDLEDYLA